MLKKEWPYLVAFGLAITVLFISSGTNAQLFRQSVQHSVAILVEQDLLESDDNYSGLASEFPALDDDDLSSRIERYAESIQATQERTETVIIPVPESATELAIHQIVKNLTIYESDQIEAQLAGIVIIGDIPLPKVDRNGIEFTSIYPYTDFVEPRYTWDPAQRQFSFNQETSEPELWHGVIQFATPAQYAEYFDKNYLARIGEDRYTPPQKLFFADLTEESISLNEDLLPVYANYISTGKQRVYQQYTAELLTVLKARFDQGIAALDVEVKAVSNIKDSLVKSQIDQYSQPFTALLSGYYNRLLPLIEQSGRYKNNRNNIQTIGQLVSYLDLRQEHLFRLVNDRLEAEIEQLVRESAAQPAQIFNALRISGQINQQEITGATLFNHRTRQPFPREFLPIIASGGGGIAIEGVFNRGLRAIVGDNVSNNYSLSDLNLFFSQDSTVYVNGTPASEITTAEQCRIHRGSEDGKQIAMRRTMQIIDENNQPVQQCFLPWESGEEERWIPDQSDCRDFYGLYLRDDHRVEKNEQPQDSLNTAAACYALRTPNNYFAAETEQISPSQTENPASIIIYQGNSGTITLADLILYLNPETDLDDHQQWSAALANLDQTLTLRGSDLGKPSIGSINLRFDYVGTNKQVPSVITHKDPLPEIENQQRRDGFADHLPVDNQRYISFVNEDGQVETIYYPDLFKVKSLVEFEEVLSELETRFDQPGALTSILTEAKTGWTADYSNLTTVNSDVLGNMITWHWTDLNSKYQQALQLGFQGLSTWGDIDQQPGYEIAVINLPFIEEELDFNLPQITADPNLSDLTNILPEQNRNIGTTEADNLASLPSLNVSTCRQYQSANGNGIRMTAYLDYLRCWYEEEVQASADAVVSYTADVNEFFDPNNSPLPPSDQQLQTIVINVEDEQIFANERAITVEVDLLNASSQRLIGNLQTVEIAVAGPVELVGDTNRETTTGNVSFTLTPTGTTGTVEIIVSTDDFAADTTINIIEPYEINLATRATAGTANAQLTVSIQSPTANAVAPSQVEISSSEIPTLNRTVALSGGRAVVGFTAPQHAGEYNVGLLADGQELSGRLVILPSELAAVNPEKPNVSRFAGEVKFLLQDQYGNNIDETVTVSVQKAAADLPVSLPQTNFNVTNGELVLPIRTDKATTAPLIFTINGQQYNSTVNLTDQLYFEQISQLKPAAQHIQLRHNQPELDRGWISNWLLSGQTQTITTITASQQGLGISQNRFSNLEDPFWGLNQATPQLQEIAASNPVGPTYQNDLDEATIIFGDPTFALPKSETGNMPQFSADMGELLTKTPAPITHMATNSQTVALATNDNEIYFYDTDGLKLITEVPLGIEKLAWWYPTSDRDEPVLLVVTEDRCSEQIGCLFAIYYDNDDQLQQLPITLDYDYNITNLTIADLTQDGRSDILIVDRAQNLILFPTERVAGNSTAPLDYWVTNQPVRVGSLAPEVDSVNNLAGYFLWRQNGFTPTNEQRNTGLIRDVNGVPYRQVNQSTELAGSSITVRDVSGGRLGADDQLEYRVRLRNATSQTVSGSLALPIVKEYQLNEDSLICNECSLTNQSSQQYPYQIDGIQIPAGQTVSITFRATVTTQLRHTSHITIVTDAGDYPADGYPDVRVVQPGSGIATYFYSARTDQGQITYRRAAAPLAASTASGGAAQLFSDQQTLARAAANGDTDTLQNYASDRLEDIFSEDTDGDGFVDSYQNLTRDVRRIADKASEVISDYFCSGGCIATPVNYAFLVDGYAIPGSGPAVPVVGFSPYPPFAIPGQALGTTSRIYVSPTLTGELGVAYCWGVYLPGGLCTTARIGLLEFIGDVCEDINHGIVKAMDSAVDVVVDTADSLNGTLGGEDIGIVVGANASASGDGTTSADRSHLGVSTSVNIDVPGFPEFLTNWLEAQRRELTSILDLPDITIIYPEFPFPEDEDEEPGPEEEPEEDQEEEPETDEELTLRAVVDGYQQGIQGIQNELDELGELYQEIGEYSMLSIKEKNYKIRYPYMTPEEINSFTTSYSDWWENTVREFDTTMATWGCYTDIDELFENGKQNDPELEEKNIENLNRLARLGHYYDVLIASRAYESNPDLPCYSLAVSFGGLKFTFDSNLEILADYLTMPNIIFEIDNFQSKYSAALIDIVNEVNTKIIGYLAENTKRLLAWEKMFKDLQEVWKDFNAILNLSLEYLKQCDDCRSHRYSNYAMLIEFLIDFPELPVFEVPKLPDITIDLSDIRAGATVILPRFEFAPEKVALPRLQAIDLPDAPPINFAARLPEFGILVGLQLPEPPSFDDIRAALDLPDLFGITVPEFPLIPLPPDVGSFGAEYREAIRDTIDAISAVMRAICLLEKGLFPIPEFLLKERIEQLTARPLNPPLPIDIQAGIGFNLPLPDSFGRYLKKVTISTHLILDFNFDPLGAALDPVIDFVNNEVDVFSDYWNEKVRQINSATNLDRLLDGYRNADGTLKQFPNLDIDYSPAEQKILRELEIDYSSDLTGLFAQAGPVSGLGSPNNTVNLQPVIEPGIYINRPGTEQTSRLIDFVPELPDTVNLGFLDADSDGDQDVLYTLNNRVYLKRNLSEDHSPLTINGSTRYLDYPELAASVTPVYGSSTTTPKIASTRDTITVDLPPLSSTDLLVLEVIPQARELAAAQSQYLVSSNKTEPEITSEPDAASSWQIITSTDRNLAFQAGDVPRAGTTQSYWQSVTANRATTLTIPRPTGNYALRWGRLHDDQITYAYRLNSVSYLDCTDDTPPQIPAELQTINVIVYQPPQIDLSKAYDLDSEVSSFYIDPDLTVDSDGDGDPRNDLLLHGDDDQEVDQDFDGDPTNDATISTFRLRSFDRPGQRQVVAHIFDSAGNRSSHEITINVTLPDIYITNADNETISGYISPAVPNIPLNVVRNRNGQVAVLPESVGDEPDAVVLTDENGQFSVESGLEIQPVAHILDQSQQRITTIGLDTGTIVTTSAARVRIRTENQGGTAYIITEPDGDTITQVTALSSGLNDVNLYEGQSDSELKAYQGVLVDYQDNNNDQWQWQLLPGDDPGFPGGAALLNNTQRQLVVTPAGRITIIDNADLLLELETVRSYDDVQWILVKAGEGGPTVARIYVGSKRLEINDPANTVVVRRRPASVDETNLPEPELPFVDLDSSDPNYQIIKDLYDRHIIDGKNRDGDLYADLDSQMSRAEFTSVLLRMMCILPGAEAQRLPSNFADINQLHDGSLPWYYAAIKEANQRGFVTGYQGQIDPATGLPIFLPNNSISRAEVAKVVLEVLESKNIISLASLETGEIWYVPFVAAAQNLNPLFTNNAERPANNFILTPAEAAGPNQPITRREFFQIVQRVLSFSNCLDEDADGDGLPYHFEAEYGLNLDADDSNKDPDGDGLVNIDEYKYGTDPLDPDTDDGGVNDGVEVNRGSDPLNPRDDFPEADPNSGTQIDDIICNQCPCRYTLVYGTSVLPGDHIFAIIRDRQGAIIQRSTDYSIR